MNRIDDDDTDPCSGDSADLQSTIELIQQARSGDQSALTRLYDRYLPRLRRWAHGRLPDSARSLLETSDVVQEVLTRCVQRLQTSDLKKSAAFHSYLRVALNNRICDEVRRARRAPRFSELSDNLSVEELTPIERAVGIERASRYEAALIRLREEDREAIIARIEMGCSFREIAELLGKPTANAARMAVVRAIDRLVQEIRCDR